MGKQQHDTTAQPWGTVEELLLACAVSRHGTKRWDSVAVELQKRRSSDLPSLTPHLCKNRFTDLKRRHASVSDADLVDQLRRIRVEELRREVQRHDDSIMSLELKVKRLKEEKAGSSREEADLERNDRLSPEIVGGNAAVDDLSADRDDRSFNESNSTSQRSQPTEAAVVTNGGNDAVEVEKEGTKEIAKSEMVEPEENKEIDSVQAEPVQEQVSNDADENKKQNSDVLSTASLSKKKRRRRKPGAAATGSSSGEEHEGDEVSPAKKRFTTAKSEPLARILGIVRSHRLGSVFERRQRSQESERYRKLIRQHMDLQIIQCRLDRGTYSDCFPKFFRDLLLLFNNFILFYRKSSPEHSAAQELRLVVQKEMMSKLRKHSCQPRPPPSSAQHKPKPETITSSSSKPNKVPTILTFGRRTSMQDSSDNANRGDKSRGVRAEEKGKSNEKKIGDSLVKKKSKELSKVGLRSSRPPSSKGREVQQAYGGANELSSHDSSEQKMEKKGNLVKKKQGVASFLRRMTQNSPSEEVQEDNDEDDSEGERKEKKSKKVVEGRRERITRSSGGRGAREENGKLRRGGFGRQQKRGRERNSSGYEAANGSEGRAKKRSKR